MQVCTNHKRKGRFPSEMPVSDSLPFISWSRASKASKFLLHGIARNSTELHGIARNSTELHGIARKSVCFLRPVLEHWTPPTDPPTELHGIARNSTEFFRAFAVPGQKNPEKCCSRHRILRRLQKQPFLPDILQKEACECKIQGLSLFNPTEHASASGVFSIWCTDSWILSDKWTFLRHPQYALSLPPQGRARAISISFCQGRLSLFEGCLWGKEEGKHITHPLTIMCSNVWHPNRDYDSTIATLRFFGDVTYAVKSTHL